MFNQKIKIAILGATGFTGLELIRVLKIHPLASITKLFSSSIQGQKISQLYPHLQGLVDLELEKFSLEKIPEIEAECDVLFTCLPHGESQKILANFQNPNLKIIDLGSDFRIKNMDLYQQYYGEHLCQKEISNFVYGLNEIPEIDLKNQTKVANPGCFATNIQLGLLPLKNNLEKVKIMAITGSSGLGKSPKPAGHHPIRSKNLKSYQTNQHRHLAEICENLDLSQKQVEFVPTSGPFVRGIFSTIFVQTKTDFSQEEIQNLFQKFYENKPFVRIKNEVQLVDVCYSNFADISVQKSSSQNFIIQVAIDNLIKGAVGSAIENMNLVLGTDQKTGLENLVAGFV